MFHLIVEASDVRLMDFKSPFISSNNLKQQTDMIKCSMYILKFQKIIKTMLRISNNAMPMAWPNFRGHDML